MNNEKMKKERKKEERKKENGEYRFFHWVGKLHIYRKYNSCTFCSYVSYFRVDHYFRKASDLGS